MRDLIDQLEQSLQHRLYYLSLFTALSIPDIAGALDSEDGKANGQRYERWYDQWVAPQFDAALRESLPPEHAARLPHVENPMTGRACYLYRCSLLHQGRTQLGEGVAYSRIIFVEPRATSNIFHGCVANDALVIDLERFCLEVISAARLWLDAAEETDRFEQNSSTFIRRYPTGLPPYIGGVPVVG